MNKVESWHTDSDSVCLNKAIAEEREYQYIRTTESEKLQDSSFPEKCTISRLQESRRGNSNGTKQSVGSFQL
jgi:hypothetical protein